jgi:hypothetical protein
MAKKHRNRKAPLSGGTEQQRKVITQTHVTRVLAIMQGWGYDRWDLSNLLTAIRIAQEDRSCVS